MERSTFAGPFSQRAKQGIDGKGKDQGAGQLRQSHRQEGEKGNPAYQTGNYMEPLHSKKGNQGTEEKAKAPAARSGSSNEPGEQSCSREKREIQNAGPR